MHYRGKLKRAMYLASMADTVAPTAGTALFRPDSEQSVGNVVNAATSAGSTRLLAVVTTAAIEGGIHLASPDGPKLEFLELPYSLDP
jgi:folate-binding Fe-S cluster repair protein YgfZ